MKIRLARILILSMFIVGCLQNIITVKAEDSIDEAQYAICYIYIDVIGADGGIIETTYFASQTLSVNGDAYAALAQAESSITGTASEWANSKGRIDGQSSYDYVDGDIACRDVYWTVISNTVPLPPVVEDQTEVSQPATSQPEASETPEPEVTIPLEAYGASTYYCGPDAGDYCITLNQNVTVNTVYFGVYEFSDARWWVTHDGNATYIVFSKDLVNTVNDIPKTRDYEIMIVTNVGNAYVYLTVCGFYDKGDPNGASDMYYNESTGLWESASGIEIPSGLNGNSPEIQQQNGLTTAPQNSSTVTNSGNETSSAQTSNTNTVPQNSNAGVTSKPEESSLKEDSKEKDVKSDEDSAQEESSNSLVEENSSIVNNSTNNSESRISEPSENSSIQDSESAVMPHTSWSVLAFIVLILFAACFIYFHKGKKANK